jgi:hypothetical protein
LERRATDPLPVVRYDVKAGERSLDLLRWGLVPYWAKDIKVSFAITDTAETIVTKLVFQSLGPALALFFISFLNNGINYFFQKSHLISFQFCRL